MKKTFVVAICGGVLLSACGQEEASSRHLSYVKENCNFEIIKTLEARGDSPGEFEGKHVVIINDREFVWKYSGLGETWGRETLESR